MAQRWRGGGAGEGGSRASEGGWVGRAEAAGGEEEEIMSLTALLARLSAPPAPARAPLPQPPDAAADAAARCAPPPYTCATLVSRTCVRAHRLGSTGHMQLHSAC